MMMEDDGCRDADMAGGGKGWVLGSGICITCTYICKEQVNRTISTVKIFSLRKKKSLLLQGL